MTEKPNVLAKNNANMAADSHTPSVAGAPKADVVASGNRSGPGSGVSDFARLSLAVLLGVGGAAGLFAWGQSVGLDELDAKVESARNAGYSQGSKETRESYEDVERREEVIARLISIVRDPSIQGNLPESTRNSVEAAAVAVATGDLERAINELPSGVKSIETRVCIPIDSSVEVETGSSITACDWPVTAFVGDLDESGKLKVSIADRSFLVSTGEFAGDSFNRCGLNFERIVAPEGDTGVGIVKVSLTCRY